MPSQIEKWTVTTPPTQWPVSLQQVCQQLRVAFPPNDGQLINMMIGAAVEYAQGELETSLMPQTISAVYNAEDVELTPPVRDYPWDPLTPLGAPLGVPSFATWGTYNRSPMVRLYRGPVSAINSVADGGGNPITNFVLERTPTGDRCRFMGTALYPVTVVYQAGYASVADIPATILMAIIAHAGTLYENRESATMSGAKAVPHSLEAFYRQRRRGVCMG